MFAFAPLVLTILWSMFVSLTYVHNKAPDRAWAHKGTMWEFVLGNCCDSFPAKIRFHTKLIFSSFNAIVCLLKNK